MKEIMNPIIKGHIKITDRNTGEVLVDRDNAVNYENISIAMANTLSDQGKGWIYTMAFGNGGSAVDPTGVITYLPPNVTGQNASLYNETYAKVVDQNSVANLDPANNKMTVLHTPGNVYTDILVTCLLDYGEPDGQEAFDNSQTLSGNFIFDELGLKSYSSNGSGKLLTHVVFHPVQKSLNRLLQIDYTIRIQSLTGFNEV